MQEIDEFAKLLVEQVRDRAIRTYDRTIGNGPKTAMANRWHAAAKSGRPEDLARAVIPDIVDTTISQLLGAIDQELLHLSYIASTGRSVDLSVEGRGELSGSYKGPHGWIAQFSKERYVDDFSHLDHFFDGDAPKK